jgi:hypothetical protein
LAKAEGLPYDGENRPPSARPDTHRDVPELLTVDSGALPVVPDTFRFVPDAFRRVPDPL